MSVKYPVYQNDMKYKHMSNIDPSCAIWNNDTKNDFVKNTNSIDYRIEECLYQDCKYLDLSQMSNNCVNLLFSHKKINDIADKLEHLFINDCNISYLPNLTKFNKLQTLDLSNNNLLKLPELPKSLEELIVKNNNLTKISNDLPNLIRLDCDNNSITELNISNKIERLHLNKNPLTKIPSELFHIYFLNISGTNISSLTNANYPLLRELNISNTQILSLPKFDNLKHLICNNSKLESIDHLTQLDELDMLGSKLERIPFFPQMEKLVVDHNKKSIIKLSEKYNIHMIKKTKNNNIELLFNN